MQDFLTKDSLGNFTFLMFIVVVATEFTKKLIRIDKKDISGNICKKVKVEIIVFLYSLILSTMRSLLSDSITWSNVKEYFMNILFIFFNALAISYFASASYDKITGNSREN